MTNTTAKIFLVILIVLGSSSCSYQGSLAPNENDPYEEVNRSVYSFNENLDKAILEPVADSYDFILPKTVQTGVQNFFNNANYPITIANQVLQGKLSESLEGLLRFTINTTIGLGGLFDPASNLGLELKNEDFGQTLGVWGINQGPYLMSPVLGPYTLRNAVGDLVDNVFNPLSYIDDTVTKYSFKIIEKVQDRSDLSVLEEELYSTFDPYQYIRDSYIQNRKYKIGDGLIEDDLEDDLIDFDDF